MRGRFARGIGLLLPEAAGFPLDTTSQLCNSWSRNLESCRDLRGRKAEGVRSHKDAFVRSQVILKELRCAKTALFGRKANHVFSFKPRSPKAERWLGSNSHSGYL